jgi:ribonuclease E
MTKRMLIDATHAEETRVVVLDGNRLEDFDVETSTKKQLKGNIYLAKVVRVEPSLQAAFVEYGGNRHGFLAFSEIHPDYYQIPVADRQHLLDMQAEEARREEEEEDRAAAAEEAAASGNPAPAAPVYVAPAYLDADTDAATAAQSDVPDNAPAPDAEPDTIGSAAASDDAPGIAPGIAPAGASGDVPHAASAMPARIESESVSGAVGNTFAEDVAFAPAEPMRVAAALAQPDFLEPGFVVEPIIAFTAPATPQEPSDGPDDTDDAPFDTEADGDVIPHALPPETVGGDLDTGEEARERRSPSRYLRNYKIQEVIRRRQILLVQVVKEERGTKGAALTSYISLAGRYCVLMPNSPRGGGISRKITSATDRRRLKEVMAELDIPDGMGLIVRTAGANRPKPEIKRDCEYLLRSWDDIRDHTMKSVAPAQIYEEASLIKRTIRDVYARDIDEILVDGEDGWKSARDFMRMLMPSHVKKVQLWRDPQPLFARQQVEAQLDAMLSPTVQLRSGGYLVINQTEALVAIDVNSGRSTRERGIEETALRTNCEAVDEVARQLRLRDLAGLIVIDLIDMESRKNNATVERRLKEALKTDRARIQVGHISHFGLMEMSRQRLRPSLAETSFVVCPHCGGTGHVRGTESAAIHVLRDIEEEGTKRRAAEIMVRCATPVAMYILNHKRARLAEIEANYAMLVAFTCDDTLIPPQIRIERVRAQTATELPAAVTADTHAEPDTAQVEAETEDADVADEEIRDEEIRDEETGAETTESADEAERRGRRRRRRRRGGRREDAPASGDATTGEATTGDATTADPTNRDPAAAAMPEDGTAPVTTADLETHIEGVPEHAEGAPGAGDDDGRGRRRGRRGGRRRRRDGDGVLQPVAEPGAEQPDLPPIYTGPTPADPFGGQAFDIFDVLERAEQAADRPLPAPQEAMPAAVTITPAPEPVLVEPVLVEPAPAQPAAVEAPPAAPQPAAPQPGPAESLEPVAAPAALEPLAPAAEAESATPAETHPVAANDPEPEPLIKPILVGSTGEPAAEPKRGWWRR